ncbi:MAG: hypothetical protein IJW65_03135 [Clostridia bacterium]|nr:hypothetical protein [Clostridia bacterium]
MSDNEKKTSDKFANFLSKASDVGKKAAVGIQKGAHVVSEQTKKTIHEQKMKKYNPLFPKQYKSKDFHLPNMIKIVDDAERRGIDVCEGAIGWLGKEGGIEVLYLYDEWVEQSGLNFVNTPMCNTVYIVDRFDKKKFIATDCVFEKAHAEKIAELEHIAYYLGAKSCTVELAESVSEVTEAYKRQEMGVAAKKANISERAEQSASHSSSNYRSGKTVTYFEGNKEPRHPTLKWFAQDDNIKNLIEMRFSSNNVMKTRTLILEGASSATMAQSVACELDAAIKSMGYKTSVIFEKKASKEHSSKLIYDIEF